MSFPWMKPPPGYSSNPFTGPRATVKTPIGNNAPKPFAQPAANPPKPAPNIQPPKPASAPYVAPRNPAYNPSGYTPSTGPNTGAPATTGGTPPTANPYWTNPGNQPANPLGCSIHRPRCPQSCSVSGRWGWNWFRRGHI